MKSQHIGKFALNIVENKCILLFMVSWLEGAYCKAMMLLYVSVNYDVTTYVIAKILYNCILVICCIKLMVFMVS